MLPSLLVFSAEITLNETLDLVKVVDNYLHAKNQLTFDMAPDIELIDT